jgi:hypothetical protein
LTNANLVQTPEPDKIAGVDGDNDGPHDHIVVTDDENDGDDGDESDVEIMEEHPNDAADGALSVYSTEEDQHDEASFGGGGDLADNEGESQADESDTEEEPPTEHLRRSKRVRKKRFVDFDNKDWDKNEAYVCGEGVMHINPAVIRQSKEDLKITSEDLFPTKPGKGGTIRVRAPPTAGVSQQALNKLSLGALYLPEPKLAEGEHMVSDHVVLHVLGVVLAEQYSINKGIRLFGDRARESV